MNGQSCTDKWLIRAKISRNSWMAAFLLRKRKEYKRDLLHSVNTNENHYQFGAFLILLCSDFVIDVLEIQRG